MADNIFDQFDQPQKSKNVFDQFDEPAAAGPRLLEEGMLISAWENPDKSRSLGLGSITRPIRDAIRDALPAAARYQSFDPSSTDAVVRPAAEIALAFGPAGAGSVLGPGSAAAGRAARPLTERLGTEAGQHIAERRAGEVVRDAAAHETLDIRPFGPSFNQGPVASIGKQITETPFIGAPLRGALDETYQGMGRAASNLADEISPVATAETAGAAAQRGLDRFRYSNLADMDPPTVRGLGIDPQAPMSPLTVMSRGAAETAEEAARIWPQIGGRTATTSRGVEVPSARPLGETLTTRTTAEMLDDAQLARLVRAPATETSVATRAEALYERAWRAMPGMMRVNETANGNLLAAVNTRTALRELQGHIANDISGQRVINGELAARLMNPRANITFADMRAVRTEIGRALANRNPLQQSLDQGQLKSLYAAISRDMEVGLETLANRAAIRTQAGGNRGDGVAPEVARQAAGALRAFRTADRYYRASMERMDRFSSVLQAQSPEQAANRLVQSAMSGNRGDIRQFRSAMAGLRPEERAEFGSMVVRNLGTPNPSARGMVQEHGFSAQSFVTRYQSMSPEARNLVFTPQHQQALENLFRVANRVANVEALANTSRTATNAINFSAVVGTAGSLATGDVMTPIGLGVGGLAASVLLSRPEYVNWMTRYVQMAAAVRNGTSQTINPLLRHVAGLERMSATNQELKAAHAAILEHLIPNGPQSPSYGQQAPQPPRGAPHPAPGRTGQFASPEVAQGQPQGQHIPNAGELDQPLPEPQEAPQQDLGQSAMPFEGGDLPQGSVDWQGGQRFARDVGGFAAEMTGVPSMIRGAGDIGKGIREGDPLRGAAGVGQVALGAMPAAGIVGRGLMSAGKAGATMAGSMLPMAAADVRDARAGGADKLRTAVEGDQAVQQLRGRLETLRGEQQRILGTPLKGLGAASADAARQRMAGPINDEIATLVGTPDKPGLIKQAEDAAAKSYLDNAPFRERYPGTAEALLYGAAGLAAALPMANTMRHRFADRLGYQPQLEAQAGRVENALRGSTTQPNAIQRAMGTQAETIAPNQGVFETERATMRNMLASRDAREPSHLGQYAAGTAIMQEARMIPEEVDAIVFPHGHPARESATNALLDPSYYAKGAIPSILGGVSMAHLGNKAGNMMSPRPADVDRAVAAAGMRWKGEARPSDGPGKMDRIGEAATQRLEYWMTPPARSPQAPASGTPSSPAGAHGAGGTGTGQNRLPPSEPTSSGLPGPSRGQSASQQSPKYGDAHTTIATPLMEGYLAKGKIPPTAQIRDDLIAAYKQAGVDVPRAADLTKRINASRPMLDAVKDAPPDVKARVLKALSESPGFLAVPAAVGVGGSAINYLDRPTEVYLTPDGLPRQ